MTTKTKVILTLAALATAFAAGRWLSPTKIEKVVEIHEVVKEVEKKTGTTDTQRNKRVEKTITETVSPDGTRTITTRIVETTDTDRKSATDSTSTTDTETNSKSTEVVEYKRSSWSVLALGGVDSSSWKPVYGAHISKTILGPISVGGWGLSSGVGGVSIGLQF